MANVYALEHNWLTKVLGPLPADFIPIKIKLHFSFATHRGNPKKFFGSNDRLAVAPRNTSPTPAQLHQSGRVSPPTPTQWTTRHRHSQIHLYSHRTLHTHTPTGASAQHQYHEMYWGEIYVYDSSTAPLKIDRS